MNTWDKRYTDRVKLLVEILPVLADEPRFALKGGTAINLFGTTFRDCRWTLIWTGCRCMTSPRMLA